MHVVADQQNAARILADVPFFQHEGEFRLAT